MHLRRPARILLTWTLLGIAATAVAVAAGCKEPDGGGAVDPYPAPDFSLPDFNPYSATWNDHRSPSAEMGKVLVVYFASFS